jgi:hypothetical protein
MVIAGADGLDPAVREPSREQVETELNRFYYDTAQLSLVGTLAELAKLVPVSQIVYVTSTRFFATRFYQMPADVVGLGKGKKPHAFSDGAFSNARADRGGEAPAPDAHGDEPFLSKARVAKPRSTTPEAMSRVRCHSLT